MTEPWHAVTAHADEFARTVAEAPDSVLLALDFDGTLAAIVADPADARLHEGSASALSRLVPSLGTVAIVTGRPVLTVRELAGLGSNAGLEGIIVLGQYGVERWDPATAQVVAPEVPESVAAARADLERLIAEQGAEGSGLALEDKGRAVGLHTRRTADPQGWLERLSDPVTRIAEAHALRLEPGRFVLELRASSHDKGDAVARLIGEFSPGAVAVVGDDLGDLPALRLLGELRQAGIVCCGVVSSSAEQPALLEWADVVCDGPDGVAAWLAALADRLG